MKLVVQAAYLIAIVALEAVGMECATTARTVLLIPRKILVAIIARGLHRLPPRDEAYQVQHEEDRDCQDQPQEQDGERDYQPVPERCPRCP